MQPPFAILILFRATHVRQAAGGEQTTAEGAEPVGTPIRERLGRGNAGMAQPGQTVLVVKSIGNVHCPVNDYFVAQTRSGVDPGNARTPPGAIVQHGCFDAAKLGRIRYFILPGLWSQG